MRTLDSVFAEHLGAVYDQLSDDKLLECCLPGCTQNPKECVNSLVWVRCPKLKWFGRKRVEMAAISAALHFSSGAKKTKHSVMNLSGISAGVQTVHESQKRGTHRVRKAQKRSTEPFKKYRRTSKRVTVRIEEACIQQEGTTYEAGVISCL